jgi:hypothetical protein
MSTIKSSTTSTTAYSVVADTTGTLVLQTGATPTTAVTIGTDQSVTFAQAANLPNTFGFKNRIINGGMVIDQRNAGAAIASPSDNYLVDRFYSRQVGGGVASAQQSSTAPTGFSKSLLMTVTTADASVTGSERYYVRQYIEGFNFADFGYGAAGAASTTVSFWVRSSVTGSYGFSALNESTNRIYASFYTISAANTWEYKTIVIPGDTTGTWTGATNGTGIMLTWSLGMGSTNTTATLNAWSATASAIAPDGLTQWISTNGATFYITGVQLEKGSTATSFDYRPYGAELALCQRYYWRLMGSTGQQPAITTMALYTSQSSYGVVYFPVPMRANPTASYSLLTDFLVYSNSSSKTPTSILSGTAQGDTTVTCAEINATFGTAFTAGNAAWMRCISTTTGYLEYSAEL